MPQTLAKQIASIILIATGIPNNQVTELTGVCDRSVRTLRKALERNEIAGLFHVGGGGRSKLANVEKEIIEEINRLPQLSANSGYGVWKIQNKGFAVRYSKAVKKNGIKRLKCGSLPAKADPSEQRGFYENVLHSLMDLAKDNKITLLFTDASHSRECRGNCVNGIICQSIGHTINGFCRAAG